MTASGSHKKRVSKRSSALSCFFLKALHIASRSVDGLRFSSLLHKERSRMAKGMSPLRLLMRNPSRKTVPDNVDGNSSGQDGSDAAGQSRQPLGPITEIVRNPLIPVAEQSSGDPSTPRAKAKISSHGQEKFPHLENSEGLANSVNVTPDKSANLQSKGKFTWQHRHGSSTHITSREAPPDLSTPPRPPRGSAFSDSQAAALPAKNQDSSQLLSSISRGGGTGGGSVPSTPKTGRSVGSKSTSDSENGGSQSQYATPKTVSRSLKYSQQGSASNSGASGLTSARSTPSQHLINRPTGYLQAVKGAVSQIANQNFVEHHFELEEDASFWRDHNIQVIIRTRPMSNSEVAAQGSNRCLKQETPHTVTWLGQPESRFTFDHVAGETISQAKLFGVAGLPMVENCISGYNSCMFAYGQTGSGKTHTMLGDIEHLDRSPSENRGMTPRVFEYLFGRIRTEQECRRQEQLKFFCRCSFLEIYNEQITDLLEPSSTNLQMREDAKKGVYVENLSEVEVQCVQDVIRLLLQGAANRKVAATNMNRESSRSHSVFTCVVESKWENNSMTNSRYGRLHLVDLAGSERQKSSGAEGGRLKEAANINKSLSTLGLVIMILVDVANGRQRHVPYRDSKLTFLLQDSLGGNSKTIMIANVSPSSCSAMETLSTLKFAQRAKFIRNNAVINEDASGDVVVLRQRIEELNDEVERLRRESILRISSSRVLALENGSAAVKKSHDKVDASVGCAAMEASVSHSMNGNKSLALSTVNNDKYLRSIEAVLAGALRREQQAEDITKKLAAEIEQLNRLVRQREEDSQCSKMILRFREEKIRRLESIADNVLSAEAFYEDERKSLIDEVQLLRGRLDRNPELTRFAMENIRLMEELRRYQEFYDGGERDVLLEEISGLRSQLLDMLDTKLGEEQTVTRLTTPQKRALAPELGALERENELLLIEVKSYQNELKECRNNLNSCLVANADLARQVDILQATVKQLQNESKEVPNIFPITGANLDTPQETASSPDEDAKIRLGTEDLALQHRHALTSVEEQVSDLRKQLKDAQDLIQELSSEVAEKVVSEASDVNEKDMSDCSKRNENVTRIADNEAVVRQGIQDRWWKLQEIEMRHSEEMTQLQLELDSMEDVLEEERQQRIGAEQTVEDLRSELSAAELKRDQAQSLAAVLEEERQHRLLMEQRVEDLRSKLSAAELKLDNAQPLEEERQQRLLAEKTVEDLRNQLSAAELKLDQAPPLEDALEEERQQRVLAEQRVDALTSKLSAAELKLDQAQPLEDALEEERQQHLLAEQRVEALRSEMSAAALKLDEAQPLEDVLKEERQQRMLAEQTVEDLRSKLSAAEFKLDQAQSLEDVLEDERQQRLLAEHTVEHLRSQLRAGELKLDQAQSLEDGLEEERQQRLLADQRVEVLRSKLGAAELKLDQVQPLENALNGERQQRLVAEQKSEELSSRLSAAVSELEQAQCLVEALEGAQLFSINELENLQSEHSKLLSRMKRQEDEEVVPQQAYKDVNSLNDPTVSILEQKLQKARRGKEEARRMNRQFQEEKASRMALDKEREVTMSEVETQAALAITTLQSEILELREEISLAVESEATAKLETAHLQKAVEALQQTVLELENNNRLLSENLGECRNLVDEKNAQLRCLEADWESATSKMIDYLADGDKALTEAADEMDDIKQGKLQKISQLDDHNLQKDRSADASIYNRLNGLQSMVRETEGKVRALSEAAAILDEEASALKSGKGEALIRESEKKSMVAFLMVGQLLERIKDLKSAQQRLVQANEEAYSKEAAKEVGSIALQQQLEELRRQSSQFHEEHRLVVQKHEDLRQEYEKCFVELETTNDLKVENVRLEMECQESCRAVREKDAENAYLREQLSDHHNQSEVMADRHQLLIAAHESLQQEQEKYLEEKALKIEEAQNMIRLSERKAMALLVIVERLVSSRDKLQAANLDLAKEIQDERLLVEQKHMALTAMRQQADQENHQYEEISEQFQLLAETHSTLRQEHEKLLAGKARSVEEGEAAVKSSERKAIVAFMIVKEILQKMKELKVINTSLTNQIQDAYLSLAGKDNAVVALQKEMSQHSEIARSHQVLTVAHDNLRKDHERLVHEKVVTSEDEERAIKLSERKAMASFLMLGKVVDGKTELKRESERLEREIQMANKALVDKNAEIVALEQKLERSGSGYAEMTGQHHVLKGEHHTLRVEYERLQEQVEKVQGGQEKLQEELETARLGQDVLQDELVKVVEEQEKLHEELTKSREEVERLQEELENAREDQGRLTSDLEKAQKELQRSRGDNTSTIEHQEQMIKFSEKRAMGALVVVEHLMETLKVLKTAECRLEKEIEELHFGHLEKDTRVVVLERHLEESHTSQKDVCDENRSVVSKYDKLKEEHETCVALNGDLGQRVEALELDLRNYHAQVKLLQEMSVTSEEQCTAVFTNVLNIALKADSLHEVELAESVEFMTNLGEGLDLLWHELSLVERAVDHFGSVQTELRACRSKALMLEEESGGNRYEMGSLHTEISRLRTLLQLKESDLQMAAEKDAASSREWGEEKVRLVFEKEQSSREYCEKEEMVQSLLVQVQRLESTVQGTELRVSDLLTSVQALIVAKDELEFENSRLAIVARDAESDCIEKELEIAAIQSDLAEVQAELSAAELREQSVSGQMENFAAVSVEWEIERAVVEHQMQEMREETSRLQLHLSYLNLEVQRRETDTLESFRRSSEALEIVDARLAAINQELAGSEMTKGNLELDMELLESAASGDVSVLEGKEMECLELKRQLRTAEVQMTQMQTAIDLATTQLALETSNREADKRRMEEEKGACEAKLRDEFACAELMLSSTEGNLKDEVQRLDSSLKLTELRVCEMLTGVKALTVAKEELELEKIKLVKAVRLSEMHCSEKEQELIAIQGDLAQVRTSLMEAELREKEVSGQMEAMTGAKIRWEVEGELLKRKIEEMTEERGGLHFGLGLANAEVEEKKTAILESFRKSQEALERVEARLTTMDQELGGLEMTTGNVEHDIALLDSAAAINLAALEGTEQKYLQMQRRLENAELQMSQMQIATEIAIAQIVLERENWEADKRSMKEDRDARETKLRDEIAAEELKFAAMEANLKAAVESVEALGMKKTELEEEILQLYEDAKVSLEKVTEQQQEIDTLREMSSALKAKCSEADKNISALNHLREEYVLAEARWKSGQDLLSKKVEELEFSAGLRNMEAGSKELSRDSREGGQVSKCLPECSPLPEDQNRSDESEQLHRQRQDNQALRAKVSDKERTILSAKKEMEKAIANFREAELEMEKAQQQNQKLTILQLDNKSLIDSLSFQLKTAEEELLKRDIKIEGCEAELRKVAGIMSDWESKMHDVESEWRREKELLAQELTEAQLVANEKRTEAAVLLQKFQDGQTTMKEAEDLVHALVKANENAKHDALDWKTEKESLGIVQGWWMPERDKLVSEVARLETDLYRQKQDFWMMSKDAVIGSVDTRDVLLVVEQELCEMKNDYQQEMEHVVRDMALLKDVLGELVQFPVDLRQDLDILFNGYKNQTERRMAAEGDQSKLLSELGAELKGRRKEIQGLEQRLLEFEVEKAKSFENMQTVVCELTAERDRALKDSDDLRVDVGSLEAYVRSLEVQLEEKSCENLTSDLDQADMTTFAVEGTDNARISRQTGGIPEQEQTVGLSESKPERMGEILELAEYSDPYKQEAVNSLHIELDHARSELARVHETVCHLQAELKDIHEQRRSAEANFHRQVTRIDQSNQLLQLYQQEVALTQDMLTDCLAVSETLVSDMHELSFELEELTLQRVETVVQNVSSDFEVMKVEIQNFRQVVQEDVRVWKLRGFVTEQDNERLVAAVEDLQSLNSGLNVELDDHRRSIDILAEELVVKEQRLAHSLQLTKTQLKAVEDERDKYQTDLVVLNEELEMAQTLADEHCLVSAQARQAAELSKSHAEQKEEEIRILDRSVEELERTVYALETQLGIVKRESDKQRIARDELEKELETLKVTIDSQEAQTARDCQDAETSKTELDRIVIELKNQQIQARKSVESLQQECAEKDVQLRSCKSHIAELLLGAEKQASENQQKLKALESMVEHLKVEERKVNAGGGSASKSVEKSTVKVKGSGSPFKCIGSGLERQRTSEIDEDLSSAKKRIKELEAVAASRQKEVFMLNTKLAEAESMTHDVVRDLLGVKMDIASYATLLNQQQVQRIAERARRRTVEAQEKEEELDTLRQRLNEFIEERESWLEEINRRQAEAVAARVSAEKLRLRDQTLTAENDRFREDCQSLRKKVTVLEEEIKKLSGQQNLQQRIHHHAKIKEENNSMRLQNEDLSSKLRRMEILFTRVNDELAQYRTAQGKSAFLNFDEEARLQKKLQETEENRLQLAETLIGLCTGIMQAAGIQTTARDSDPSTAMTALQELQDRQESLERELSDCKLKARIADEKRRLTDLREFHTPVKTICTSTNFTASQHLPSPVSSSR